MPEPLPDAAAESGGFRGRIDRLTDVIGEWTSWVALVIVVLMSVNVVLRYLFSVGSVWSQELEWHLLVPLILFGMSYAQRHGEHVRVDILYAKYSERTKALVDLLSAFLAIALSVIVIWLSIHYVEQAYVIDEGSPDPGGIPHRFLIKSLIPIGFALLLLQSMANAIACVARLKELR